MASISLISTDGKVSKNLKPITESGTKQSFSLTGIQTGTYQLKITTNKGVFSSKLMVAE